MAEENPATQRQTAGTAVMKSNQLLLFESARQSIYYDQTNDHSAGIRPQTFPDSNESLDIIQINVLVCTALTCSLWRGGGGRLL